MNATRTAPAPATGAAWKAPLVARWRALSERDRLAATIAGAAIALLLVWWIGVQPALRTVIEFLARPGTQTVHDGAQEDEAATGEPDGVPVPAPRVGA